jgi:molecular chaperone GrpE
VSSAHEPAPGAAEVEDPLGPPATAGGPTDPDPVGGSADDAGAAGPAAGEPAADGAGAPDRSGSSVEELIADLERTSGERDEYLDALRRNQADFENYRKRVAKQAVDDAARAAESLVDKLLPVLDACDGAILHGATEVEAIFAALLGTLEKEGLQRIDPVGEAFDPNLHEAVLHEPGGEGDDGTVVSAVMRPGYAWKGRVVRPAMVKVKG